MKAFFLTVVIFSSVQVFSQFKARGFYVSMNNDSVWVTFNVPKKKFDEISDLFKNKIDFSAMRESVTIIDSLGNEKIITPAESKGFAFTHDSTVYKLFAKPIDKHHWCFLRPQIMGRKMRLLYFIEEHPNAKVTTGPFGTTHYSTLEEYFWTFEKYDRTYLFLRSTMKKREMVGLLKEYFSDNPQVQELIEEKFQGLALGDLSKILKSIVDTYNEN